MNTQVTRSDQESKEQNSKWSPLSSSRRSKQEESLNSDCGIRMGELWKVSRLIRHLGIGVQLMKTWQDAGLHTVDLGSDSPFILTDDLFAFYRKHPKLAAKRGK